MVLVLTAGSLIIIIIIISWIKQQLHAYMAEALIPDRVSGLYEFDDFALHCQLFIFFLRRKRVLWPKPKPHLYVNKCRERERKKKKIIN